jgi:hypothetical protein
MSRCSKCGWYEVPKDGVGAYVPGTQCPQCGANPELSEVARVMKADALSILSKLEERTNKLSGQVRDLKGMLTADRLRAVDLLNLLATYDSLVRLQEQEHVMLAVEKCRVAMSALHEAESQALDQLLTDSGLGGVSASRALRGGK